MSAIVTDQFRILNASNFVDSVNQSDNSYYVVIGLPNSSTAVGFGRSEEWDTNTPDPEDSFSYNAHFGDTIMYGKKISSSNIRRIVRRLDWASGNRYEMYRHDYSLENRSPIKDATRLYDANYYVLNSDFRVYVCIDNGSDEDSPSGNISIDEPKFTDLEPSKAGDSGDGYLWKYLFTISPSDVIKFDDLDYITVPDNWENSSDFGNKAVRDSANSSLNSNQIKKVYIADRGSGYQNGSHEVDILGDGSGARVRVTVESTQITDTIVVAGGKGYSWGIVDLGSINGSAAGNYANLVPIIPPSLGHGYDVYKELGADRVLIYARFDDSTENYPTNTRFAQVGIIKNPTSFGSESLYEDNTFTNLYSVIFKSLSGTPTIGEKIRQSINNEEIFGYVASYDEETKVLKYFYDRSLFLRPDTSDYAGVSTGAKFNTFRSDNANIFGLDSNFSGEIFQEFSGITTNPSGTKVINLGVAFNNGFAEPQINTGSGDLLYIDNRSEIVRNSRQKEDIKIVLEF